MDRRASILTRCARFALGRVLIAVWNAHPARVLIDEKAGGKREHDGQQIDGEDEIERTGPHTFMYRTPDRRAVDDKRDRHEQNCSKKKD